MMIHGVTFGLTPRNLGGEVVLLIEEEYLSFCWDKENFYYNIYKPTIKDLEELENFELNTPPHP